jgi:hypothetical protein
MAKKNKSQPLVENPIITEKERLEFIIKLNENAISDADSEIDTILREQVYKLRLRIEEL